MKKLEIGQTVRVTEDFLNDCPCFGSPVGEIVETESTYEEGDEAELDAELDELLERAAAWADERAESRIGQ